MKTTTSHRFRLVTLGYLTVSLGLSLYLYNQLLSLPKPIGQEYFDRATEAVVLAVRPKTDQGIYLWLQLPDRDYPGYYVMPWSGRAAEELEIAQREAREQDGTVVMRSPFSQVMLSGLRGADQDRIFYPALPSRPLEKAGERIETPAALRYVPPDS